MSLIHKDSCDCVKSELDLFSLPLTQTSVENGRFVEYGPISTLTNGPIEFNISGSESEYIDFTNTLFRVKVKLLNEDGTNLVPDTEVAPVNYFLHSMFSQVDMFVGDTLVTSSTNTYPYRSYIETLLSYGEEAKKTQLTAALWYKDSSSEMGPDKATNTGFNKRMELAQRSNLLELMGKLHLDIMFQPRYLLNGVDVKLRLIPTSPSFCIIGKPDGDGVIPNYKFDIVEAKLLVRKVKLSAAVQVSHADALEISSVKYPIRRVECKTFNISRNLMSDSVENLFTGQLPKRIVLGMVKNSAFNGEYKTNPFNFEHFYVQKLSLSVDGQQVPAKSLEPNFKNDEYIQSYIHMLIGCGMMFKDDGNDISRNEYKSGYTLFAYDLTPDLDEGGHVQLIKTGIVSLDLKFAKAIGTPITVIAYAEYENLIEIDKDRQVTCDYSA